MNPNSRIVRNIFTNAILRPGAALLDGRMFLAVYNFMMETMSAGSLLLSKKALGSAESQKGLIGKLIKKFNITDPKKMKGLEFIATHSIQTFLILGVILGLTSTILSRHITNFTKNILNIKDEAENENEVPVKDMFPAAKHLTGNVRSATSVNHQFLSQEMEAFLLRTQDFNK